MDSGFDEGDFKKARGMLLSFSSVLIALWFFGADLKSVSVLGTTVAFTQNTQHVWLVALAANSYFLLRFYQHSPGVSYSGNKVYERSFKDFLINNMRRLNKEKIKEAFFKNLEVLGVEKNNEYKYGVEKGDVSTVSNSANKRRLTQGIAHIAKFHVRGEYRNLNATEMRTTPAFQFDYPCPYWLVVIATYRAKIVANIKTSLGTEYSLPYLWSSFAAVICLVRWLATQREMFGA